MIHAAITAPYVERILIIPFLLFGLSHMVQPQMWVDYFTHLPKTHPGNSAMVTRTFSLELWPALLIVCFHQVWTGPALFLTLYGHAQLVKIVLAMLYPPAGMRSIAMAHRGPNGFRIGGVMLMTLGVLCTLLVFGRL